MSTSSMHKKFREENYEVVDLNKTDEELRQLAYDRLFTRNGTKPRTKEDFIRWGALWGRLQIMNERGFDLVRDKKRGGFMRAKCRECGKEYLFNQRTWQFRHSYTHLNN